MEIIDLLGVLRFRIRNVVAESFHPLVNRVDPVEPSDHFGGHGMFDARITPAQAFAILS